MASGISQYQLLNYLDNPSLLPAWSGAPETVSSTPSASSSSSSLFGNINDYLSGANNWLQNLNNDINPFTITGNALSSAYNATANSLVSNPYFVGLDNMISSITGNGSTSLGLGGTTIPNTPSTPGNSPTELGKTAGAATGNLLGGTITAAETAVNTAVSNAINKTLGLPPGKLPQINWSLIILAVVVFIIIIVIAK